MRDDSKTGGPAFPTTDNRYEDGMSLRDWFAGLAMQGLLAADADLERTASSIAAMAYEQADMMLEARGD